MKGKVYLVGAGVLGVENLTVKAYRLISEADVILYDRLVDPSVLRLAKPGAETAYVGKEPGEGPQKQMELTELMIKHSKSGKVVVRLKSGDPFVFGRGGEELLSLREAGVDVEVVPGLTSAVAIPTIAGIPLTMRDLSSSILILTGHLAKASDGSYFKEHAKFPGTVVLLMSLTNISTISRYLIEGGMSPNRPVVVITSIARSQRLKKEFFRLWDLVGAEYRREGPGVVVIGEVVGGFKD
ncbi:MAG: uroporphyrinogen-III C-methyltransferase [Candidatus Methanosuratincola sp.]|jgi:uroporphyrin-III C-methyltransferase|nr:uroporphyrinogen-III C-methyltransferase [Candidatus Methanosuratincola sp.]